jgi:hypothetical protein
VEQAYLEENDPFHTLKTMTCRKYSIQNLIPFSQGNNAVNAAASDICGFLWIDTCVS